MDKLQNGSILVGGMGTGKTLCALWYFYEKVLGGSSEPPIKPIDIYVITTAKKRDTLDWPREALQFGLSTDQSISYLGIKFTVDSWNNIVKYVTVSNAFFIFDEQRAVGYGVWSKSLIKIARKNRWIMLSGTPADRWIDLMPVFVANGFYRNATEFIQEHVVYSQHTTFPKISRYIGEDRLRRYRNIVYVMMPYTNPATPKVITITVKHDEVGVNNLIKKEWNPYKDKPVRNISEFMYVMRKIINSDPSRIEETIRVFHEVKKLIIFYNFDYELFALRDAFIGENVGEYNGHKHDELPFGDSWVYLVQYTSGAEGWECFTTNHLLFYSLNYSYRLTVQAMGRINRMNTVFSTVYYYRLVSESELDKAITRAYNNKKNFNLSRKTQRL